MSDTEPDKAGDRPAIRISDVVHRANLEIQERKGIKGYYSLLSVPEKDNGKKDTKAKEKVK